MADSDVQRWGERRSPLVVRVAKVVLPLVIIAAALAFVGYLYNTRPPVARNAVEERVWIVSAVPAAIADVQPELRLYGEITAGREVELRPLVAGRVVEVGANYVDGAAVRAGELLIAIDPFTYETRVAEGEAQVAENEAKRAEYATDLDAERTLIERDRELVALRDREVKRRRELREKGTGSQKALDDALMGLNEQRQRLIARHQSVDRLAARVAQQEAVIERLKVGVRRARRDLEETRLAAPFDGFLVDADIAVGKMMSTGDRVARLIDANWLEARLHMSDAQFAAMMESGGVQGRPATVIWRAADQAFRFAAAIDRVGGEIDAASGGIDLFARLTDTGLDTVLRPGAFVEVRIPGPIYRGVVRLPESALHAKSTVYVAVDGRLEPRAVDYVARDGNDVLVRGTLAADEAVVTTAFAEIGPGVRVEVR